MGPIHQRLGQQAGEQGAVELGQVGQVGIESLVEGVAHGGVTPSQREHPEPRQHVEDAPAPVVDQFAALAPDVEPVEAEGAEHPHQLRIEMASVQVEVLAAVRRQQRVEIECHASATSRGRTADRLAKRRRARAGPGQSSKATTPRMFFPASRSS